MDPKESNARLEAAAGGLAGIERKRMPGGYALFAGGKIFANVTVDGRIGVKLPVLWCFEELAAQPGADPWRLGQKTMEHWVLVPQSFHQRDTALREWVGRAHSCAVGKLPVNRATLADDPPPPTARSSAVVRENSVFPRVPQTPAVEIDSIPAPPTPPRSRRSFLPAPPSYRNGHAQGLDLSSYAPPPPSSVGIRVVPRDSKSPYEDTIVGVPAPSSSQVEITEGDSSSPPRR